jgi:hypothetical protein
MFGRYVNTDLMFYKMLHVARCLLHVACCMLHVACCMFGRYVNTDLMFYKMSRFKPNLDNPDQRVQNDASQVGGQPEGSPRAARG